MITTDEMRILLSVNGAATYTTTINKVINTTENYNKTVGSLMSTLTKLVSAGLIVKFGKQCIETADNVERLERVTQVTFGAMTDAVDKWTKAEAANYGLTQQNARNYLNNYGILSKQLNFTSEQAAKMSVEMTKLTGNVSAFYNITEKQAAEKLEGIFTGNIRGLKELGIIINDSTMDAYLMSKGISASYKELDEQGKAITRYQYALEKLKVTEGAYQANAGSYANSVKEMKIQLEQMKIEVGRELIPVAAQGLEAIGSMIKAVSPFIISIAQTVRYYSQAWAEASESTKAFVKIAVTGIALMYIIPKVVVVAQAAVRLLTARIVGLNGALAATAGALGFIFAILAFMQLSKAVEEMKNASGGVENLGDSASISSENVDTLSDSLDGLADSAQGLDTFLASFDEVNKVGGGNSLMSSLVTAEDLANILGAATGVEDLQNELNSLSIPEIGAGTIFSKEWWEDKKLMIFGFLDTIGTHEFVENWKKGIWEIDEALEELMPHIHAKLTQLGADIYDALHPDAEKDTRETFTFTDWQGRERTGLKYNEDGTLTDAYLNQSKITASNTVTNTTINNTSTSNQPIDVTLMLDGRTLASVVTDLQNEKARSSGMSPVTN